MAKKVQGTCCICGQEANLTFEHIPPRAAFNYFNLKVYDFLEVILHNNTRYKAAQKGAGIFSLCSSCNNLTGEWYGAAYAEFVSQGMTYYHRQSQGLLKVPYTIYPLRVLKQIISCFASVNGPQWCQQNPAIKQFLLDPRERYFPPEIDIRMYMQEKTRMKLNGITGQMNVFTGEHFVGSEWGYPPFSYICVCNRTNTNYRVLNELYSVRQFLQYDYDERAKVYLNIPRKPCNPITLDFRKGVPDIETIIRSNKDRDEDMDKDER